MAPLLRASFHGLRCSRLTPSPSFSSPRELLRPPREPLKPPESSYIILRRWYGESVILEEICSSTQTVNDTAGESKAVVQGEDSSVVVVTEKSVKETPTANVDKQECAVKELSSSDKLSSLIMGKLRSKNTSNALKDNATPLQTEVTSSKANKLPEGGSQQIGEDKLNQVINSMRNMAAKKRQELASSSAVPNLAKSREAENQDDFADLDLPPALDGFSSKSDSHSRSAMDALRNFIPKVKPKEAEMHRLNGKQKFNGIQGFQQRAQEGKSTSFSFLNSLDSAASAENSSLKTSLEGLNSFRNSPNEAKNASFKLKNDPNYFKSLQNSTQEAKNASSHEVRSAASREFERTYVEEKEKDLSNAKEVANVLNRTTNLGFTVCIQNLPSQSNLALVKEALSLHGEVVSSFRKCNSDGSCKAFIEFKTAEAMESALASRWFSLDSKAYSIVMADAPITTVVRLSRVSADTTDSEVASICAKFGSLDHLKQRANGIYDAYYKANELSNMPTILDSLNEVTLNQRRLVALPAPRLLPTVRKEVLKRSEGQAWQASQFSETLNRLETGLEAMSVLFEDLRSLATMEDEISKLV